jgi:hypothetical protein
MKLRWRALTGLVAMVLASGAWSASYFAASAGPSAGRQRGAPGAPARALELFYTPPILVRAGEPIRIPIQVVCATVAGSACSAQVTLGTREGAAAWRLTRSTGGAGLQFDVTAPAERAATGTGGGSVGFFIKAEGPGGASASLGESSLPLRFYVTGEMPVVALPRIPFGHVRSPQTVLFLPWGSGPRRAGVQVGRESATLGPSSFDVDGRGRILLLDGLQGREAVFSGNRLLRETRVGVIGRGDVAVTPRGVSYVLAQRRTGLRVQRIDRRGRLASAVPIGKGILSQIRTAGEQPYADVLPLDAWVPVAARAGSAGAQRAARPLGSRVGLLSMASGSTVRLGMVRGDGVMNAVELRSSKRFGELALAEPDGQGGYWAVVRVWREGPRPADQYQVVHERGGRVVESFAVADQRFAGSAPLGRFRLGPDGALYQMMSEQAGLRIVRYDLGGTS